MSMEDKLPAALEKNSTILVIGAGTWGTGIAYRLAEPGYGNFRVLDACDFPSIIAAANDVNKILEEGYAPALGLPRC